MDDSPGKRLVLFRQELGLTQAKFGAALGVSPATIAFIERNERPPSRSFLQKIADRYSISSDWLLYGSGERHHTSLPHSSTSAMRAEASKPAKGDFSADGEDFSLIQRFNLSISAGPGLVPVDNGSDEQLAFSRAWLLRNGVNAQLSGLVKVKGDSMAPTVPDGSLVLVHAAERVVDQEAIFAFTLGDEAFVKRLVPIHSKSGNGVEGIVIVSDNPVVPTQTLTGDQLNDLRIAGRVRCVLTAY